jgi:hypothetical protein
MLVSCREVECFVICIYNCTLGEHRAGSNDVVRDHAPVFVMMCRARWSQSMCSITKLKLFTGVSIWLVHFK